MEGIDKAEHTIQIVIFRFDRGEIEAALTRAARRGVFVHALVAYTSQGQGGEQTLRNLEMRLLADGVSVARTATDLVRYHDKLMIIDQQTLYMLGFNYTYIDTERSRSFGIVTQKEDWVREAVKLFTADATRQQYTPECDTFLVSPGNSRRQLLKFLQATRRQLCIYDGELTDPDMIRLMQQKAREGVDIRIIGAIGKRAAGMKVAALPMRLHAQTIIRDGEQMFLGSQSLRTLELDARREVGILVDEPEVVQKFLATFEADWSSVKRVTSSEAIAAVAELEPVEEAPTTPAPSPAMTVKEAVKEAIKTAIMEAIEERSLRQTCQRGGQRGGPGQPYTTSPSSRSPDRQDTYRTMSLGNIRQRLFLGISITLLFAMLLSTGCLAKPPQAAGRAAVPSVGAVQTGGNVGVVDIPNLSGFHQVVALSDAHGMFDHVTHLLAACKIITPDGHWLADRTLLIVTGDFIDKGSQSLEVLDLWRTLQCGGSSQGKPCRRVVGKPRSRVSCRPHEEEVGSDTR